MEDIAVIQASVAVYPLLQTDYRAVHRALEALRRETVKTIEGTMATTVIGEPANVFAALERAFSAARESGPTVMTVTVTNACPLEWTGG